MVQFIQKFFKIINFFVIILSALFIVITSHELGHFLTGFYFGFPIDSFNLGLGPILYSDNLLDTPLHIRLIPLGGYVLLNENFDLYSNSSFLEIFIFSMSGIFINFITFIFILFPKFKFKFSEYLFFIFDLIFGFLKFEELNFKLLTSFILIFSGFLFTFNILPLVPLDGSKIVLWCFYHYDISSNIIDIYSDISFFIFLFLFFYLNSSSDFKHRINAFFWFLKPNSFRYSFRHITDYSSLFKLYKHNFSIYNNNLEKVKELGLQDKKKFSFKEKLFLYIVYKQHMILNEISNIFEEIKQI